MDMRRYSLDMTMDEMIAVADHEYQQANEIVAGLYSARRFALAWYDHHRSHYWEKASDAEREAMADRLSAIVLRNARDFVKRGRGWYLHQTRVGDPTMLVVCGLVFDDPGEPKGYLPMFEVDALPESFGFALGGAHPAPATA